MDLIAKHRPWKERADEKVAQGLCAQCKRTREDGRRYCRYHLDYYNERSRMKGISGAKAETHKKWHVKRQARATAEGLCRYCAAPKLDGIGMCGACRDKHREWRRYREYGITSEQYESLLRGQNYGCAICGTKSTGVKEPGKKERSFMIDHCHKTGVVRGLLCHHCNLGIGQFRDRSDLLSKAIAYLGRALPST